MYILKLISHGGSVDYFGPFKDWGSAEAYALIAYNNIPIVRGIIESWEVYHLKSPQYPPEQEEFNE